MKAKNTDSITLNDGTQLNGTERCVLTLLYRHNDDEPIKVKDLNLLLDVTQKTIRNALHSLDDAGLAEVGRMEGVNDGTPIHDPLAAWLTDTGHAYVDDIAPGEAESIEDRVDELEGRVERLETRLVEQPSQEDIEELEERVESIETRLDQQQKTTNSIRRVLHEADLVDDDET